MSKKITLKEAREQDKLEEFIKEHENDAPGDADELKKLIDSISKSSSPISADNKEKPKKKG